MSKKDYIAIAKIIKLWSYNSSCDKIIVIGQFGFVEDLIEYLKRDNPRFDEKKFREACKLKKEDLRDEKRK